MKRLGSSWGLLLWDEALEYRERWHFNNHPKLESGYMVITISPRTGHICINVKLRVAASAKGHGG